MKARNTFAPLGPWIVTADEIDDPQELAIKLWVNEELKQNFNTNDMAHKIPRDCPSGSAPSTTSSPAT